MREHPPSKKNIWISGVNPVREALKSEKMPIHEIVLARSDQRSKELAQDAARRGIPVRHETREALAVLVGHPHHQGVALSADDYPYAALESILELAPGEADPLLILDCIQDPQNLGALIRSACFLGARGLILPKDRSARVTSTVIRVAAGATSHLPIVEVTNLARSLEQLKKAGFWVVGLDVEGAESLYEVKLPAPLCLVVGNEQKGLRPLISRLCDLLVRIPAWGPLQSLNAATAGAVALAEVQRQRRTVTG